MKILVLGATGQIGQALVDALSRTEHDVSVMVRHARARPFPPNIRVVRQPEFSAAAFRDALQDTDYVIYGIGLPEQFTFDPQIFERVNCALLATFLEALRQSDVRRLTYISTYEVFQSIDDRIDETHPVTDESDMTPYFQSMVRAYRAVVDFARKNDVSLTTIHPAAVFGGLNTGGGITDFMKNLVAGNWHKVPFITRTRFPVVHVASLSDAVIKSIGKPGAYIASDQMTSLAEIARTLRSRVASSYVPMTMPVAITKLGASIVEAAGKLIGVKPFASTVQLDYLTKGWEPRPDKAIRELSWKPMTLAEGIDRFLSAGSGDALGPRTDQVTGPIDRPGGVPLRTIARLQLFTAAGLLIYWPLFFTVGLAPPDPPFGYFVFQHSFAVPDIILALAFIRAATWLLSDDAVRRRRGRALSLVCSGALLFLGMLDISFNIINGVYFLFPDSLVEVAVNAWCIGFGALSAWECAAPSRYDSRPVG